MPVYSGKVVEIKPQPHKYLITYDCGEGAARTLEVQVAAALNTHLFKNIPGMRINVKMDEEGKLLGAKICDLPVIDMFHHMGAPRRPGKTKQPNYLKRKVLTPVRS